PSICESPSSLLLLLRGLVRVQIVKQEWPERWPTFLTEVCASCRSSQSLCENNMRLLNMLSEEVFDFGEKEMVSRRVAQLMQQLTQQFQEVFDVCMFVLRAAAAAPLTVKESLVQQTLRCLAHYLKWIPLGYIFQTDLLQTLLHAFWEPVQYRADTLRCLTEIASLQLSPQEQQLFKQQLTTFWMQLVNDVLQLPSQTLQFNDPTKVPPQMRLFWESFYAQLALCLTVSCPVSPVAPLCVCVCVAGVYQSRKEEAATPAAAARGLLLGMAGEEKEEKGEEEEEAVALQQLSSLKPAELSWRVKQYADVLNNVRKVMIKKMAKPQEVYIQFDEETGEVTREHEVDTGVSVSRLLLVHRRQHQQHQQRCRQMKQKQRQRKRSAAAQGHQEKSNSSGRRATAEELQQKRKSRGEAADEKQQKRSSRERGMSRGAALEEQQNSSRRGATTSTTNTSHGKSK
ncbi:UNVERIFIED_CONTAM: hypothetical protein H355_000313, partial [Colinus virginianus]